MTVYSEKLAETICQLIADGNSLREIAKKKDMPCIATIMNWCRDNKQFLAQYTRAKEVQAEGLADEMIAIADDTSQDIKIIVKNGKKVEVIDHENINRSRLRVDTRKWVAMKLLPKKYGDKIDIDANTTVTINRRPAQTGNKGSTK